MQFSKWLSKWAVFRRRSSPQADALLTHVIRGPGPRLQSGPPPRHRHGPPDYLLVHDRVLLGHLWEEASECDFPWIVCTLHTFDAFQGSAEKFVKQQELMAAERFQDAEELNRMIDRTGPAVVLPDDPAQRNIALGLQIAGGRAWFRLRPRAA